MNLWENKTIFFLGDSITEGAVSIETKGYVDCVEKTLNCNAKNYGVSGTRIAKQPVEIDENFSETFLQRARRMVSENKDTQKDFVFVFGGTNDYGHGEAPMGSANDFCDNTFNGAINQLIDYLIKIFSSKRICFILPLPRFMQSSVHGEGSKLKALYPLSDYIKAEKSALCKRGVDYLDLSEYFPEPTTKNNEGLFFDGLHLNDEGHKLLAKILCEYLSKKANEYQ